MMFAASLFLLLAQSPSFGAVLRTGLEAIQNNDLAGARVSLESAAKMRPEQPQVWLALAQTYWKLHESKLAGSAAETAERFACNQRCSMFAICMSNLVTNCLGAGRGSLSRLCLSCGCGTRAGIFLFPLLFATPATSQDRQARSVQAPATQSAADATPDLQTPKSSPASSGTTQSPDSSEGQQTKRILGIVPNFQAVSANTHLPPLSFKQKFWLATEGTFDYSSFISAGMQAAIEQATNTYPEFHQGAAAYGRYYWHTFADAGVENYLVAAILPAITHEDPRYYTLFRGGFFHRTRYAISRLWITKTDAGAATFNFSEILGSCVAMEVSSRYYPRHERAASEILERWASLLLNDGVGNVVQEFWPDINHKLFHRH